jgi:hypothetical protein
VKQRTVSVNNNRFCESLIAGEPGSTHDRRR